MSRQLMPVQPQCPQIKEYQSCNLHVHGGLNDFTVAYLQRSGRIWHLQPKRHQICQAFRVKPYTLRNGESCEDIALNKGDAFGPSEPYAGIKIQGYNRVRKI